MQRTNKLSTRLLAMVMTVMMVCTMMSTTVFAETNTAPGISGTVTTTGGTPIGISGTDLTDAIGKLPSGTAAADVTELKITAGAVTTDDWNYLEALTAMTRFEIATTVTDVANIPDKSYGSIFCESIATVTVPQAIIIGENAFSNCTALTTANFPKATAIGERAFLGCNVLTAADFPKVTSTGVDAFKDCSELESTSFPVLENVGQNAFAGCNSLTDVSFPEVTSIGMSAFSLCRELVTASFPNVDIIDMQAFDNCSNLATLKLGAVPPQNVDRDAFTGCTLPTRALGYVDESGNNLRGEDLIVAEAAYKAISDGNTTDNLWYGWIISAVATDDAITISINGETTTVGGATLEAAIAASGKAAADVTKLKITAGTVTEDDWNYLKSLTALETFEIDSAVTDVADIPNWNEGKPIFPDSIVTVTVPQAIKIGDYAFYRCLKLETIDAPKVTSIGTSAFMLCTKLTAANFPEATTLGKNAFQSCSELITANFPKVITINPQTFFDCTALTTVNFPEATGMNTYVFYDCTALTTVSFPKMTIIGDSAFSGCTALTTLKLGATVPTVRADAFMHCPDPRNLVIVAANGNVLTGADLTAAYAAYDAVNDLATDYATDGKWYGWIISAVAPPTPTPPSGGSDDSSSSSSNNVINNPVGNTGTNNAVNDVVKAAVAAGKGSATSYINFTNYTALTMDGLKAINDAAAKAVEGKKIVLNTAVQLDKTAGGVVTSRITVDPAKLAKVMTGTIGLNLWFNQKNDTQVTSVNTLFTKHFDNKLVTITFEQKAPLAVNIELALKPDLSGLNTKNLYFYSYNPTTNVYNRIWSPNYWVDKNGYSHITAPFGGSVIVTDKPLTAIK